MFLVYTFAMKREKLKQIIRAYYSFDSTKSIMCGRMRPSFKMMSMLNEKYNIPFKAWKDIKSFITNHTESVTKNNDALEVQKKQN